jgi:DMSO/TMAO reductase YedYZ molybdopterin-dependent catalytic subunit
MVRQPDPRLTSRLGLALGVAFGTCFLTGLASHLIQHPPGWFWWPARPVRLYQVTQGLHVATGLASVPLLWAKLWSVYPRLFTWPPVRGLVHAVERASIAVLVSAALFELVTGVLNITHWYSAMPFSFPAAHYWTAWLAVGALVAHVGVQLPVIRQSLAPATPDTPTTPDTPDTPTTPGALRRRGVLGAVAAASGLVTLATVGQTLRPLAPLAFLAPRRPDTGPQRTPVNRTADAAGVRARALDPGYRLIVTGPGGTARLSLDDLAAMPQHTASLPIACVEGWSSTGSWGGVRLRDVVRLVGGDPDRASVLVESLQTTGGYRSSVLPATHVRDPLTLIALRLYGQPLHLDHGYPARLIAPDRPGVLQTKWIGHITVQEHR